MGAGPEVRVGTCLPRSPEAVVSLLGIVKSGAAPVLIDPALPGSRIAFMLRDAGARTVVTVSDPTGVPESSACSKACASARRPGR